MAQSTEARPSVSWATLASSDESAPPLKATTTRPSSCSRSLRSSRDALTRPSAPKHVVQRAHHARVERAELGVARRGLVEAHLVDAVLQVVGMGAEERHAPLEVVEAGRSRDHLEDASVEGAAHLAVPEHELLARVEVEGVPVVALAPPLGHRVEAERRLALRRQLGEEAGLAELLGHAGGVLGHLGQRHVGLAGHGARPRPPRSGSGAGATRRDPAPSGRGRPCGPTGPPGTTW